MKRRGYTLIELLVVIALIASLSALLFPVFSQVREGTRRTACLSNLRQIGLAMAAYSSDYDGYYPYGADPIDKYTHNWWVDPKKDPVLSTIPLLHDILYPYVKNHEIWHCPSDTGADELKDTYDENLKTIHLNAHPTVWGKFGSSYVWRTELAFRQKLFATGGFRGDQEVGCADLGIATDLTGSWHGGANLLDWQYNTLMGDGHVRKETIEQKIFSMSPTLTR